MKNKRHLEIIKLIKNNNIGTQEELVAALEEAGIDVTQATVSRDIKKLGLIKIPDGKGGYKYSLPSKRRDADLNDWLKKMVQDFVIDLDYSENLILIKTVPGTAGGLGAALDNANWSYVMGTIAGDDTIMIITKPIDKTDVVFKKLEDLFN